MNDSPVDPSFESACQSAARAIAGAEALLITSGAGMGVDSGLPDFRGPQGFWKAYPPYERLGLRFEDMASPATFAADEALAWGFYGHRLDLYRRTKPHAGFAILRRWGEAMPRGCFVFTSNVDGQFQQAGFDPARIVECHGSIHHLQCTRPCGRDVWSADEQRVNVDLATGRAVGALPSCPQCGRLARPNILLFSDGAWHDARTGAQQRRFASWLQSLELNQLVVVEIGAGDAIPTVRRASERLAAQGATLLRINPREAHGPAGTISLPGTAATTLKTIAAINPI